MNIPKYVIRAYETLKEFNYKKEHSGLTLVLGPQDSVKKITYNVSLHPLNEKGSIHPLMKQIFEQFGDKPVLFDDVIFEVYSMMTNEREHMDSFLAFDPYGHIIKRWGFLTPAKEYYRYIDHYDESWGSRHWSAAAASIQPNVTSIVMSEEKKLVTTFRSGKIINKYLEELIKK